VAATVTLLLLVSGVSGVWLSRRSSLGLSALFFVSGLVVTEFFASILFAVSALGVEVAGGVGAVGLFTSS
jgi:predicted membrane metal-binding protein